MACKAKIVTAHQQSLIGKLTYQTSASEVILGLLDVITPISIADRWIAVSSTMQDGNSEYRHEVDRKACILEDPCLFILNPIVLQGYPVHVHCPQDDQNTYLRECLSKQH